MKPIRKISVNSWIVQNSLLFAMSLSILIGCKNTNGVIQGAINGGLDSLSGIWLFLSSNEYTFDSNKISVANNKASLSTVTTIFNSTSTFSSGTYLGTSFSGGTLKLDTSVTTHNALSSSWAPNWSNLIGYWKMDNDWQDSSGNLRHGTPSGNATFTTDAKIGSHSGLFDGDNDYVTVPDSSGIKQSQIKTISFWFKKNGDSVDTTYSYLLRKGTTWNSDSISFYMNDGSPAAISFAVSKPSTSNAVVAAGTVVNSVWYHVVGVIEATKIKLYIDGEKISESVISELPNDSTDQLWIASSFIGWADFNGNIDELAIWNSPLTEGDVKHIYHRQKQKYAGSYASPIIDMGNTGAQWSNLSSITNFPYLKELTASGQSEVTSYSNVTNLTNSLLAVWHLNETTGPTLSDGSGNSVSATAVNTPTLGTSGILDKAVSLTRSSSHYLSTPSVNLGNQFTISIWANIKPTTLGWQTLMSNTATGGSSDGFKFAINSWNTNDGIIHFETGNGAAGAQASTTAGSAKNGDWHHYAVSVDRSSGLARIYVDGVLKNSADLTIRNDFNISGALNIGRTTDGSATSYLDGSIDEVAVWTRNLGLAEIVELYRRGANRVRYQVKSCVDSSCQCASYNTSPAGSSSDCDGDGIPNSTDTSDINKAQWLGGDGTAATYFSELQNNTSVGSSGSPTGSVNSTNLTLDWSNTFFTAAARPASNRYFQYQVHMESSDENNLCSSAPCSPEISSISVGPTGRYYGGNPTIEGVSPISVTRLTSLQKTDLSSCTKYQISLDAGVTWQWWNGSSWSVSSNDVSNANYPSDFTTSRLALLNGGQFKFKAFLITDSTQTQPCELSRVSIDYVR